MEELTDSTGQNKTKSNNSKHRPHHKTLMQSRLVLLGHLFWQTRIRRSAAAIRLVRKRFAGVSISLLFCSSICSNRTTYLRIFRLVRLPSKFVWHSYCIFFKIQPLHINFDFEISSEFAFLEIYSAERTQIYIFKTVFVLGCICFKKHSHPPTFAYYTSTPMCSKVPYKDPNQLLCH